MPQWPTTTARRLPPSAASPHNDTQQPRNAVRRVPRRVHRRTRDPIPKSMVFNKTTYKVHSNGPPQHLCSQTHTTPHSVCILTTIFNPMTAPNKEALCSLERPPFYSHCHVSTFSPGLLMMYVCACVCVCICVYVCAPPQAWVESGLDMGLAQQMLALLDAPSAQRSLRDAQTAIKPLVRSAGTLQEMGLLADQVCVYMCASLLCKCMCVCGREIGGGALEGPCTRACVRPCVFCVYKYMCICVSCVYVCACVCVIIPCTQVGDFMAPELIAKACVRTTQLANTVSACACACVCVFCSVHHSASQHGKCVCVCVCVCFALCTTQLANTVSMKAHQQF